MTGPQNKSICPSCRAAYDATTNFCARCGTDMRQPLATQTLPGSPAPTAKIGRATTIPVPAITASQEQAVAVESSDVSADPLVGRLIDTRYRVMGRLGTGGMGIVYKVEHQRMGKIAAMKVLHRDLASDPEVVKRFRREAEAVSKLNHPCTVQTFDFGTFDGGLYLVMEYVRGEDLGAILRRDGPLPFARASEIFLQICGALAEAHELGIVHRDLKPENILVTRGKDGRDHAKVLDFGLAKLSERPEAAEVTGRGEIIGTPYYMSPEQIRGEELDRRSDIYSFGAVMYKVLTGEPPFTAQSPVGVLTKHLTDDLIAPSDRKPELNIDERVEAAVMRAMAKRMELRFGSIDELRDELERIVEEMRHDAPSPSRSMRRPGSAGGVLPRSREARPAWPVEGRSPLIDRRDVEGSVQEPRLGREDFDSFERSVKRGVWVRALLVLLLLGGGAAAGIFFYLRSQRPQPQTVEMEPNNTFETATLIGAGQPVRGKIGQRTAENAGDSDFYMVHTHGRIGAPVKLSLGLSGIPNIDLAMQIFDHKKRMLANIDARGVGEPEVAPSLGIQDDMVYIRVAESPLTPVRVPTENLTDEYELAATVSAPVTDEELEPNDVDSDATPIAVDRPVRGWFATWSDVDCYRFGGARGTYEIEVAGAEPVQVRLRVGEGELRTGRKQRVTLAPDDVIKLMRVEDPVATGARPIMKNPEDAYTITVRRAGG